MRLQAYQGGACPCVRLDGVNRLPKGGMRQKQNSIETLAYRTPADAPTGAAGIFPESARIKLHDNIGALMVAAAMDVAWVTGNLDSPREAGERLDRVSETLAKVVD